MKKIIKKIYRLSLIALAGYAAFSCGELLAYQTDRDFFLSYFRGYQFFRGRPRREIADRARSGIDYDSEFLYCKRVTVYQTRSFSVVYTGNSQRTVCNCRPDFCLVRRINKNCQCCRRGQEACQKYSVRHAYLVFCGFDLVCCHCLCDHWSIR